MIRRALLSAWDKSGLVEFAQGLQDLGVDLVASGGTAEHLAESGIHATPVEELTEIPEMLGGRVKTLHPRIHAAILARRDHPDDLAALDDHGIEPFDLVCVGFYPFTQIVSRHGVTESDAVEMIDIGGPSMLRAAAKNFAHVAPVCSPKRYPEILEELRTTGRLSADTRRRLAAEAFATTAAYETAIATWFLGREAFPDRFIPSFAKAADLSYGENPHQRAAYYVEEGARRHLLSRVDQLHGKQLSFNNLTPPPDFSRWLWSQDHGIYDVRDLGGALAVQAAGYGGGSLIYANVHIRPPNEVFERGWPAEYTGETLRPYFDLAAYMLGATPIPQRLAKTLQLQRAADPPTSWFRTPLAVNFSSSGTNRFGRVQNICDMRGRCWRGCDHQAKNTLDLNYLARAEDEAGGCDIRTMSEVTSIEHDGKKFIVNYDELVFRDRPDSQPAKPRGPAFVTAGHVFLCAGAVNTTELLLKCNTTELIPNRKHLLKDTGALAALGSHYFPNSDSLGVVFDCDEAHEPDYGPTITSALLYDRVSDDALIHTLDFEHGSAASKNFEPVAGSEVGSSSGGEAVLAHDPILDWGGWAQGDAVGALALTHIKGTGEFKSGDELTFAGGTATAVASTPLIAPHHWFLVEDGGYPPDLEPLVGAFRSPLWLRRNRYLEEAPRQRAVAELPATPRQATPLRRPPAGRLRVEAFADALGATSRTAFAPEGLTSRTLRSGPAGAEFAPTSKDRALLFPGLLGQQLETIFPDWFLKSLAKDRKDLLEQAAALALPMLSQVLDELAATVANQIDPETRSRLSKTAVDNREAVDNRQLEILVRGLLRQVVQILAGSEVAVATRAAKALLNPLPGTPKQLVDLLANAVLWAIAYDTTAGHTGVLLTMGRDAFRGRLDVPRPGGGAPARGDAADPVTRHREHDA